MPIIESITDEREAISVNSGSVLPLRYRTTVLVLFIVLTVLAGIAAYYKMFTGFGAWDDEGTLMLSVKQYLGGMKLYDQIVSAYGPVYYFYNWVIRTISATAVTHNAVRMSSILPWLLTATISFVIVFWLTKSLTLSCLTHIGTFSLLSFFANEPGHPQELCILLLVFLVGCAFVADLPQWRFWGIAGLGIVTSALLFIKINIGIFMIVAAGLALLAQCKKNRLIWVMLFMAGAGAVALPIVLMKTHFYDGATRAYFVIYESSVIAMLAGLLQLKNVGVSAKEIIIAAASFAVSSIAVVGTLLVSGVSLRSLVYSLIISNFRLSVASGFWYIPIRYGPQVIPWSLFGLFCGLYFAYRYRSIDEYSKDLRIAILKISAFVATVLGAVVFHRSLFELVLPFAWLILFETPEKGTTPQTFPRAFLCSAAVLQTLYAYPIAGSQKDFIQVLLLLIVASWAGDFFRWRRRTQTFPALDWFIRKHVVEVGAILCVSLVYAAIAYHQRRFYESLPSLEIAGADRIHLPLKRVREYHWLIANLKADCDVFVGLPEIPSLHIWTSERSVAELYLDAWILSSTENQQAAAIRELSQHPSACAVYNPDLVAFWNRGKQDLTTLPLVHYIQSNFKIAGKADQYYLLVRNDRSVEINSLSDPPSKVYAPGQ